MTQQENLFYTRSGEGSRFDNAGTPNDDSDDTANDPYKYALVGKQLPDTPIAEADRFDFNEESISVASNPNANITITDQRDGQDAATMAETSHFAQLRSRVTLDCDVTAVGTYVITNYR